MLRCHHLWQTSYFLQLCTGTDNSLCPVPGHQIQWALYKRIMQLSFRKWPLRRGRFWGAGEGLWPPGRPSTLPGMLESLRLETSIKLLSRLPNPQSDLSWPPCLSDFTVTCEEQLRHRNISACLRTQEEDVPARNPAGPAERFTLKAQKAHLLERGSAASLNSNSLWAGAGQGIHRACEQLIQH